MTLFKANRFLSGALMLLLLLSLAACKLPAQVRKEEAERQKKQQLAEQQELKRQAFCRNVKKLKVGMTDDEIEAAGVEVYPMGYRKQLKCDPKHPNKLLMRLQYIKFQFGDGCRVLAWELHPRSKCQ